MEAQTTAQRMLNCWPNSAEHQHFRKLTVGALRNVMVAAMARLNDPWVDRVVKLKAIEQIAFMQSELHSRGRAPWRKDQAKMAARFRETVCLMLGTQRSN